MLRIRKANRATQEDATWRIDYEDPYLALTSLLVDAATLEHSLLSVYLYAMFSVRDAYKHVRGELDEHSFQPQPPGRNAVASSAGAPSQPERRSTFLDVTIEEMQHLAIVNQLLYELCAAPCLERHNFPHRFEIYPFPLDLRSLNRFVAATFTWIEAPRDELRSSGDPEFVSELISVVNEGCKRDVVKEFSGDDRSREHLGSLYNNILERLDALRHNPPSFLPSTFPWGVWSDRIDWVRNQGEIAHYRFFRSLFDGTAFGSDASIWTEASEHYPAVKLEWKSAFGSRDEISIPNGPARQLAWLSNLVYWSLLCLLDVSYRTNNRKLIYVAIEQMASGLWSLGLDLAHTHGVGMPFDVMLVRYNVGRDEASTLAIIERLVLEARNVAEKPEVRAILPRKFDTQLFQRTLDALRPRRSVR
jgi:Ferritin-like